MSQAPEEIDLQRHRELEGRHRSLWYRRAVIGVLLVIVALALANFFGQRPTTSRASSPAASLTLRAPTRLRGGLMYEARFEISATGALNDAHLVLSSGWLEGITINTIEPSVSDETSADGQLSLALGRIPAGHVFVLFMQSQVNPTTVAHRKLDANLFEGGTLVASIHRTLTVFP
jgi:hypothetical protein